MKSWLGGHIDERFLLGIDKDFAVVVVLIIVSLLAAFFATKAAHAFFRAMSKRIASETYSRYAEIFGEHRVLERASSLFAPICFMALFPFMFPREDIGDAVFNNVLRIFWIYFYVVLWRFLVVVMSALNDVISARNKKSIRGFIQILQLSVSVVACILIVSAFLDKSPVKILAGVGASAAVLMFVFKDALLGFVASIQLSANRMLEVGDWITMDKFDADGIVIEIGLTVVKIRNWDNTIANVPTYDLVSNSFRNWRSLEQLGGRRVARCVYLDIQSISFCTEADLEQLSKCESVRDFIETSLSDAQTAAGEPDAEAAKQSAPDTPLTNAAVFRAYLEKYLQTNRNVRQNMLKFVRYLQPTEHGLPLQMYFFTTPNWVEYEKIQSDIIEHALVAARRFNLRVFQEESDFRG